MAKKSKIIQMPSPENYIRSRARSLEIYECRINSEWESNGIANLVVARRHTNGNITAAIFLVDLHCLGVKNSMYMFNVSEQTYREKLSPMEDMYQLINIDYKLAHNIVFAALSFAAEYGFNPHKSFTAITRYMLEEDTEDIELIDITCGIDGKPAYFQGPNDDAATVKRILQQLERTAGKGNFNFTIDVEDFEPDWVHKDKDDDLNDDLNDDEDTGDEDFDDDDTDDDDIDDDDSDNTDDDDTDDYDTDDYDDDDKEYEMEYEAAVNVFKKHESSFDELETDQAALFLEAVEVIFESVVDETKFEEYYTQFAEDLNLEIDLSFLPEELIRFSMKDSSRADTLIRRLQEYNALVEQNEKKALKMLGEIRADFPENPFVSYLELYYFRETGSEKFRQKLSQYEQRFPDYPLIKIFSLVQDYVFDPESIDVTQLIPLHEFYPGRKSLYALEIQQYLSYALITIIAGSDPSIIAAFQHAMIDNDFPEELMEAILPVFVTTKLKTIYSLLQMEPGD